MSETSYLSDLVNSGSDFAHIPPAASSDTIWSREYWANKAGVKLNLWRKRPNAPDDRMRLPLVFLVHGSSNAGRTSYDLTVPGKNEYSFMNVLAQSGYDVWTMDHDGYGRSGSSGNNSDFSSGVEDLRAAMEVVARETGTSQVLLYGTSAGAIRAGAYTQEHPDRVARLIISAFTYKGTGSPEIARRAARISEFRARPTRKRDAAMIRSIFIRDGHPHLYDMAVPEAIIAEEMKFGDTIPTGTYLDMAANLPKVDPRRIPCPVLMLRGEYDSNSTNEDLIDFFLQLPNADKQFAILPETAHAPAFGCNRHLLWRAVQNFFGAPPTLRLPTT